MAKERNGIQLSGKGIKPKYGSFFYQAETRTVMISPFPKTTILVDGQKIQAVGFGKTKPIDLLGCISGRHQHVPSLLFLRVSPRNLSTVFILSLESSNFSFGSPCPQQWLASRQSKSSALRLDRRLPPRHSERVPRV